MQKSHSIVNFVGARAGATGTLDDLKGSPPVPKAWVKPDIVNGVIERLQADQHNHSRLDLHSIIVNHFYDTAKDRYRIVWSKNMITSAGVSLVRTKGGSELVLHLRDGEEERGENPRWNPCYAAFATDYGFEIVACNPRSPQEKGRVENAVGYVKKNFLSGHSFKDFAHIGPAARRWLDQTANVRVHRTTGKTPQALWEQEKAQLLPLPLNTPSPARVMRQRATSTFRLCIDTNRYSVPAEYASHYLDVHLYAEKILIYHEDQLIAEHWRDYSRHEDHENPDHVRALLVQRQSARRHKQLQSFLQLGEHAEAFYQGLQQRRLNAHVHISKILALQGVYSRAQIIEAISDAHQMNAHSSEYIINILSQRTTILEEPGPLHLTRPGDQLQIELPPADLSVYDKADLKPQRGATKTNQTETNNDTNE